MPVDGGSDTGAGRDTGARLDTGARKRSRVTSGRSRERLVALGTVPLMSAVPPRDDNASADAAVALENLAVRAVAQGLGVPLVDLHAEPLPLAGHGLGSDGVHPRPHPSGARTRCSTNSSTAEGHGGPQRKDHWASCRADAYAGSKLDD